VDDDICDSRGEFLKSHNNENSGLGDNKKFEILG
jgi:hypothetical protein